LDGKANWTTFVVGVATLATILMLKGSKRLPGILIAVIGATVVVGALDLAGRAPALGSSASFPRACPCFPYLGSPTPISRPS
jgi:MFS superfamily sulfate permease-like transporter